MASILTYSRYLQFGLANAQLVADAADVAYQLKAAPTFVDKVAILNPFLERVAPKADELAAIIAGKTLLVARVPGGTKAPKRVKLLSVDEMRKLLLEQIAELPTPRDGSPRDAKWLDAGIEIFRLFVLPLILQQLANRK